MTKGGEVTSGHEASARGPWLPTPEEVDRLVVAAAAKKGIFVKHSSELTMAQLDSMVGPTTQGGTDQVWVGVDVPEPNP
jgi:hypothetical protein